MISFRDALAKRGFSGITPIAGLPAPPGLTRSQLARTGDPLVDAVLAMPVVQQNVDHPVVVRGYTVPYGAGGSVPLENPETYLDEHVPSTITVDGVTFDPAEPYVVHENVEQAVMEILVGAGISAETAYKVGHYLFAEKAEGAWYRANGIDQAKAEAQEDVWLAKIQHENPANPPPDLYRDPYPHDEVAMAHLEPFVEPHPTPAEAEQCFAVLRSMFGMESRTMNISDAVKRYLNEHAPEIAALMEKSQPGAADVHQTTAIGNSGKGKRRNFKAALDEMKGRAKVPAPDEDAAKAEWAIPFDIVKQVEDEQLVFGWASVSSVGGQLVVDKQDDVILEGDLEKAAYDFVLYCREQGDMHERKGVGRMVESMVFTKQKQDLLGIDLGMVGWWAGFKVDDAGVWKRIKAGELPEFSIGGKAKRVPMTDG